MTDLYVITGGPGTGKSSLIEMLKKYDFYVVPEAAARIIREEKESKKPKGETIIPEHAGRRQEFQKKVFDMHSDDLKKISPEIEKAFLDRSHVDNVAYCKYYGAPLPEGIMAAIKSSNYKKAYILEQMSKKDYIKTEIRYEGYKTAQKIHAKIYGAYKKYLHGKIVKVPLMIDSNIKAAVLNNSAELDKVIYKRMSYILKDIKGNRE